MHMRNKARESSAQNCRELDPFNVSLEPAAHLRIEEDDEYAIKYKTESETKLRILHNHKQNAKN